MSAFTPLFGSKLQSKDGEVDTVAALEGKKAVGIYFSAHWCPPCRGFTPKLAEYYIANLKAKGLEIIFVSSDRDEDSFNNYFAEMPWLALPFSNRDGKAALSKKFKVQGIPSFVILGSNGETITKDGRSKVSGDPTGEDFPWKPKPWAEVIGSEFLKGSETVGKEAIAGKTLGVYFSAHWCPPCRAFTPKLCEWYAKCQEKGHPFEIIFSTGDRDEESFKSYYKEMQAAGGRWLAIPYADSKRRDALDSFFGVEGIPTFAIIDATGTVINPNARGVISSDPEATGFPWAPPLIGDLAEPEGIDENISIAVFADALPPEQQTALVKQLEPLAQKYKDEARASGDDPKYLFFVAKNAEGPVPKVREMCKLGAAAESSVQLVLLDIPDNGGYYRCAAETVEITTEIVETFIQDFEAKKLERQQLG